VHALRVVEHLNVVEQVLPRIVSGLLGFASDAFAFEQVEQASGNSIVMTVAPAAHAVFEIVLLEE